MLFPFLWLWLYFYLVNLIGDVDKKPGLKYSVQYSAIFHWNLRSIIAHNFIKVSLLKAHPSTQKMDLVCPSDTFLDSSVPDDNDNLQIPGYSSVRNDQPLSTKRDGVQIYYKVSYKQNWLMSITCINE